MIGIFDSGSGGLTVLKAIRERLPSVDVLYFGDIRHAPYGVRAQEELSTLTMTAIRYLQDNGANSIVSACNSVSASLAVSVFDALSMTPQTLIEMVGPTVRYFYGSKKRLLLCATAATVRSGIYQNAFRMIEVPVTTVAIPDLAAAIEFGAEPAKIEEIIREAFAEVALDDVDTLILSCTHYPLVIDIFRRVVGDRVAIFDPADAVADRVEAHLWPREVGNGDARFVITKESEQFRQLVSRLFPGGHTTIEVIQ